KYDELVLATGSSPKELPQLNSEEYNNVFKVKNINDAKAIYNYINDHDVQNITIVGGGFIGRSEERRVGRGKRSRMCTYPFTVRRRHTRSKRDWSSDVCSSDLNI